MFETLSLCLAAAPVSAESGNMLLDAASRFGVDWKMIVAQMINFVIVAYLLYRFAFKPVLSTLSERQQKIADGLQYSEEMREKLKETELEQTKILSKASLEAKEIIDLAREQAKNYTERQAQEAVARAEALLSKADESIALQRRQMLADVKQELAGLVVSTSEKVLGKQLSSDERSTYNKEAAKDLGVA